MGDHLGHLQLPSLLAVASHRACLELRDTAGPHKATSFDFCFTRVALCA